MRRCTWMFLFGGLLAWMFLSMRRKEKRTIDKLFELVMDSMKSCLRRSMIFGRIVPSILLRRLIRRFS